MGERRIPLSNSIGAIPFLRGNYRQAIPILSIIIAIIILTTISITMNSLYYEVFLLTIIDSFIINCTIVTSITSIIGITSISIITILHICVYIYIYICVCGPFVEGA